ncbi:MAG: D-alanyl-D-alanine carboxypeptidase family protein [Syntrophomonas sp.]
MRLTKRKVKMVFGLICLVIIAVIFITCNVNSLFKKGGQALSDINPLNDSRASGNEPVVYPDIQSEAAIAIDAETGKILFAKNKDKKMYPASTTKLMTALILAEKKNRQDILTYSSTAKQQEANKLDFPKGSKMTADSAMQAMLVFSANDIAYMIGENVSGDMPRFVELMNKKASSLGLTGTHFANPCGLHNTNHYTTAIDLSIIARESYKNNWIMTTLGMDSAHIKKTDGQGIIVYNTNTLLGKNGCIGGKTGHTSQAGKCLVAYYKKNNKVIISIILNAPDDEVLSEDMATIVDWSYKSLNL